MPSDVSYWYLLAGLALAAIPSLLLIWLLQRRLLRGETERVLLQERLEHTSVARDELHSQLDESRDELDTVLQHRQALQMELAALRREAELLQQEQLAQRESERQWSVQREQYEQGLRALAADRAALTAELQEHREGHQQRLSDLQNARDELRAQFAELAGRIFDEREQRFNELSGQRLGQLLEPLKERIQSFEKRVEESYQQEARERFSLAKELERLQQLNQRLSDEATSLTRALQGQKIQGNWGELVLERVLESAGLEKGREYQTQVSLKSVDGERFQPDVVVKLPGERHVIIDAKVSLLAYRQYIEAEDDDARQRALKQHLTSLRGHLRGLAGKDYARLEGLDNLDFVLLFVPIEAAFAVALQGDPVLFQEAFDQRIVIVSPTTLLAILRVIDSLWRQERQSQNAREIAERAGQLYDKFVAFITDLDEIGSRLQQAEQAYGAARNKLVSGRGNLVGRVEKLRLLGARAGKQLSDGLLEQADQPD